MNPGMMAFEKLRPELGTEGFLLQEEAQEWYGKSTSPMRTHILGALLPTKTKQIVEIMVIAQSNDIPIYPVSTGRNWGYGTALPPSSGCVIIDLCRMDRIIEFDKDAGVVTLEPGVTQQMLFDWLAANHLQYLVPTTGAGPRASIVGNALERGYGIVPSTDHFGAVMSIEAVLPNGSVYHSALQELGGTRIDNLFKWGLGPYLEGLFAQGNFGIVTKMAIALRPRPDCIRGFICTFNSDEQLEEAAETVREVARTLNGIVGGIQLMDAHRLAATTRASDGSIDASRNAPAWIMIGTLYGNKGMVKAAQAIARAVFKKHGGRSVFLNRESVEFWLKVLGAVPGMSSRPIYRRMIAVKRTLDMMHGTPSNMGFNMVYRDKAMPVNRQPDPARDGVGIVWYSPLIPMAGNTARQFQSFVTSVVKKHGFKPMITLLAFSDRCFDSTIPLLFNVDDAEERQRARVCYEELFEKGRALGFVPYRVSTDNMKLAVQKSSPFWSLVSQIKSAIDPKDILAPGRYSYKLREWSNR